MKHDDLKKYCKAHDINEILISKNETDSPVIEPISQPILNHWSVSLAGKTIEETQRIIADWSAPQKSYAPAIEVKRLKKSIPANAKKYPHYFMSVGNATHIDLHDICDWLGVSSVIGHAIKKLACAGKRGAKSERQDLLEAIDCINRRVEVLDNLK
jgi:hypothetical protein